MTLHPAGWRAGVVGVLAVVATPARADDSYLLDHADGRYWLSGQLNVIGQAQPGFAASYTGPHSLRPDDHAALSVVATAYAGVALTPTTAIVVALEAAGGGGLSDAVGVAGYLNLDVVRNPTLGATPYLGRAFLEHVIPLADTWAPRDRDPLRVLPALPSRRLTFRIGKLSTADAFDVNAVGSDSHLQFLNWAVANNGAYDYAADTRGYTLGAIVEYASPCWSLRLGELAMPTVANGLDYDTDVVHARGENLELELHDQLAGRAGTVRLLAFANHAHMGSYRDAIARYLAGQTDAPDVTATRAVGRVKYGAGIGVEHELGGGARGFARLGWASGDDEAFAYTEIEDTVALGGDLAGARWGRAADRVGVAAVSNGLSADHRRYLALGGQGFLLGDGRLRYRREQVVEAYYTARASRGISVAVDVQVVAHPGYNADRGPVAVGALRLHLEL